MWRLRFVQRLFLIQSQQRISRRPVELAWFAALCDDDYQFLGVPNPQLASSWLHCSDMVMRAENNGFDNVLLPSGYELGVDATTFAAAAGVVTERINLLLAVRAAELVAPQLARQVSSLQDITAGRLVINAISSDIPGQSMSSDARYRRTTEYFTAVKTLLEGKRLDIDGEFVQLHIDAPSISRNQSQHGVGAPPIYFGGLSAEARECAANIADVYLMWPDITANIVQVRKDVAVRAATVGRTLRFGWRSHVVVRETEAKAREAARLLLSQLDDATGQAIRSKSLDSTSAGVARQSELRENADADGYIERHLWAGIGRARSGAGIAIVGDPDQVTAKINELIDAGIDAFIFSGYPHLEECDMFAQYVLPNIAHAPLAARG
jgi:alkanesulfonate monooxygenase